MKLKTISGTSLTIDKYVNDWFQIENIQPENIVKIEVSKHSASIYIFIFYKI